MGGNPDPKHISTSFVERQNLSIRLGMRPLTGPTNGFSKKLENQGNTVALYFSHFLPLTCAHSYKTWVFSSDACSAPVLSSLPTCSSRVRNFRRCSYDQSSSQAASAPGRAGTQ